MYAKDFETIWARLQKREKSVQRHPSHYLSSYDVRRKQEYAPYFEYKYDNFKKEYEENISNCINIGTIIEIEDIETLDIETLITKVTKKE